MALTYLNSQMIELPAQINNLSTNNLTATNVQGSVIQSNDLITNNLTTTELNVQDVNFPSSGGNVYNNTNIYGDLTVTGGIVALSGLQIVPTTFVTTTALSVVNTGATTPLFVSQQVASINSVAEFRGTGTSILKINNTTPDNYQTGVEIYYPSRGAALKVANISGSNIFVVTSGDRVGVNTDNPRSSFEVNGGITSTNITSLTGGFTRVNAFALSGKRVLADDIHAFNFYSNNFYVSSFQTSQNATMSSFSSVVTANRAQIGSIVSSSLITNTINALTGRFDVLDITSIELSGFQINGNLGVSNRITTNTLTATTVNAVSATISNVFGNVTGDVTGSVFGDFTGTIIAGGSIDGNIKINPGTTTAPTLSTQTGSPGQLAFDTNFFYVCVGNNTWKRVALSAWN